MGYVGIPADCWSAGVIMFLMLAYVSTWLRLTVFWKETRTDSLTRFQADGIPSITVSSPEILTGLVLLYSKVTLSSLSTGLAPRRTTI